MNVIEKKRNSKMQFGRQTLLYLLQPRNSRRRLRHRVNLTYESLEARSLLATFTVTTAEDTNTDVSDGMVSLREAVIAANTNASFGDAFAGEESGDIIRFSPTLNGSTLTLVHGKLEINDDLLIQGGTGNIAISGGDNSRIFDVNSSEKVGFGKLKFVNGNADGGGAMRLTGTGKTLLYKSTFQNNNTMPAVYSHGGAVYFANGNLFVIDSIFKGNGRVQAVGFEPSASTSSGGAIYQESGSTFVQNGSMNSNVSASNGGAISINGGSFYSVGLELKSNTSRLVVGDVVNGGSGGAIYAENGASIVLQGGSLMGNSAGYGGAIEIRKNCTLFINSGCEFQGNQAWSLDFGSSRGASISNLSANLYVNDASFLNNNVFDGSGGGIFSNGGKNVFINSLFSNNQAAKGGGIFLENNSTLALNSSTLTENNASNLGGGIFISSGSYLYDFGAFFTENTPDDIFRG